MNSGFEACDGKVRRLDKVDSPRNSRSAKNGSASPLARISHTLRRFVTKPFLLGGGDHRLGPLRASTHRSVRIPPKDRSSTRPDSHSGPPLRAPREKSGLARVSHRLRRPVCRGKIQCATESCACLSPTCGRRFAVIDGVAHLLDEKSTVFQPQDLQRGRHPFAPHPSNRAKLWASRALPTISKNIRARENYLRFAGLLKSGSAKPHVLVIGGATVGDGLESILCLPSINFVESDVYLSERTALICDARNIPFEDETFDGVIAQAVLEHVADPNRCVEEIHRVLKMDGVVYADTPFMQQVHAGGHDFTRFTHVGQRRLFRKFEEVSSGASCGPAMALAWAYQYFLLSFVRSPTARRAAIAFARVTGFWLKYLDHYLVWRPGSIDAASALYFLGKKSNRSLSDAEIISHYRGLQIS